MNKQIIKVLSTIENNGYIAYLIGGYVRDYLLGIKSLDIDICTNALPKDIRKIFNSNKSNYGCVNIRVNNLNIDITTFKEEGSYVNRKPTKIYYTNDLKKDLLRRDFTINTICMNKSGKVIDLLNGIEDLNNKVIRLIGDIDKKLQDDPLRILRAIRFATILDFEIENNLFIKIKEYAYLTKLIPKERIKNELDKILMSKNYNRGLELLRVTKIDKELNIDYDNIIYVDDLIGMWAQLKVSNILFTNSEKRIIMNITKILEKGKIDNLILYKYGLYPATIAGKIMGVSPKVVSSMYNKLPIKKRSDINIDVRFLGNKSMIGKNYKILEELILNNNLKNNYKSIIKYLDRS